MLIKKLDGDGTRDEHLTYLEDIMVKIWLSQNGTWEKKTLNLESEEDGNQHF